MLLPVSNVWNTNSVCEIYRWSSKYRKIVQQSFYSTQVDDVMHAFHLYSTCDNVISKMSLRSFSSIHLHYVDSNSVFMHRSTSKRISCAEIFPLWNALDLLLCQYLPASNTTIISAVKGSIWVKIDLHRIPRQYVLPFKITCIVITLQNKLWLFWSNRTTSRPITNKQWWYIYVNHVSRYCCAVAYVFSPSVNTYPLSWIFSRVQML